MCPSVCGTYIEVRRQLCGDGSLFQALYGFWRSNSHTSSGLHCKGTCVLSHLAGPTFLCRASHWSTTQQRLGFQVSKPQESVCLHLQVLDCRHTVLCWLLAYKVWASNKGPSPCTASSSLTTEPSSFPLTHPRPLEAAS